MNKVVNLLNNRVLIAIIVGLILFGVVRRFLPRAG